MKRYFVLSCIAVLLLAGCSTGNNEQQRISHTVFFETGTDSTKASPDSITIFYPECYITTLPTPPTKTGYEFTGWKLKGSNDPFTTSTYIGSSMIVVPIWKNVSYSYAVSFDSSGADLPSNPTVKTVSYPSTTIDSLPTPPQKTGYEFLGWIINGTDQLLSLQTIITSDINVTASWKNVSYNYTVTFNSTSADIPATPSTKTVSYPSTTLDSLPSDPVRTDYVFTGWYIASKYTTLTTSTTIDSDVTATASWRYKYVVEYVVEGSGTVSLYVTNPTGGHDTYNNVVLTPGTPKKYRFETFSDTFPYISAQLGTTGGTVTVSAYHNGTLKKTETSSGAYAMASAYFSK